MFLHYRTKGIVLKKEDKGEADQLFTIFTKDFGKLEVLGRGIRKITSKLRSGLEIFSLSEIEFVQGKISKILTDAILIEKFEETKKDLGKLKVAFKIAKILDKLISGQEADERIWELLKSVFEKLNNLSVPINNLKLIFYFFFWNLASLLGYQPELHFCLFCRKRLKPKRLYFSPEGGTICGDCFEKGEFIVPIKPETVKILRKFLEKDWEIILKLRVKKKELAELEKVSKIYLKKISETNEKNS